MIRRIRRWPEMEVIKMKSIIKKIPAMLMLVVALMAFSVPVSAETSAPISEESAVEVTD